MNYGQFAQENFVKKDGSIDWGKAAIAWSKRNNGLSQIKKKNRPKSIEELSVFQKADKLGDIVWDIVLKWNYFAKKTIGDQWVRATDSIAANITEGYGRYFFGEYIVFLYYARGSAYEAKFWLEKAHKRGLLVNYSLLDKEQLYTKLKRKFNCLPVEINKVIKIIKNAKNKSKKQVF